MSAVETAIRLFQDFVLHIAISILLLAIPVAGVVEVFKSALRSSFFERVFIAWWRERSESASKAFYADTQKMIDNNWRRLGLYEKRIQSLLNEAAMRVDKPGHSPALDEGLQACKLPRDLFMKKIENIGRTVVEQASQRRDDFLTLTDRGAASDQHLVIAANLIDQTRPDLLPCIQTSQGEHKEFLPIIIAAQNQVANALERNLDDLQLRLMRLWPLSVRFFAVIMGLLMAFFGGWLAAGMYLSPGFWISFMVIGIGQVCLPALFMTLRPSSRASGAPDVLSLDRRGEFSHSFVVGAQRNFSLRERCQGGPVRDPPLETPAGAIERSRRIILLIHGFNVDHCAAEKSYAVFLRELFFQWRARTILTFWPGDAALESQSTLAGWLRRPISAGSYPYQPNRAELAARVLARHISEAIGRRRFAAPIRLSIVAHSLGCRLTLELLRLLESCVVQGVLKIELVVLMAPAVPIYEVKRNKNYDLARTNAEKTLVYFSSKDKTLRWYFRPGQRFMSSDPTNAIWERGALGYYGVKNIPRVEPIEMSHDHSDYWPDHSIPVRVGIELDRQKRPLSRRALIPRSIDSGPLVSGRDVAHRQMRFGVRDCNCGGN